MGKNKLEDGKWLVPLEDVEIKDVGVGNVQEGYKLMYAEIGGYRIEYNPNNGTQRTIRPQNHNS